MSATRPDAAPGGTTRAGRRDRRRAWFSLLLLPVGFVAAFLVGEGLASALGYPSGAEETPPFWVILLAGVPALLVFVLPALLTIRLGRRAVRAGDPGGLAPAVVAATLAAGFVVLNLLAFTVQLLGR